MTYKWRILLLMIVMVVGYYTYGTYSEYQTFLQQPLKIEAQVTEYTVKPGASMRTVARDLRRLGLLEDPTFLVVRARMREIAQSIKVGEYEIPQGTRPDELLDMMVKGRVKQYSLTLIEGWTFREVMDAVNTHPQLTHTLVGKTDTEIMNAIGGEGLHPEGQFFPETYRFPLNTTDVQFLKRAYRHMQQFLEAAWKNRKDTAMVKDPYEALILASIIEKETADKSEYRLISGVFSRRLKKGMRLQTDPTVIYGMGSRYKGNIKRKHLREDTPYNTYVRKGLTPTPIAIPSGDAIKAALDPAPGEYLYFVSKGDGSHYFSKTLKEHNEAVIKYQLNGDRRRTFSSKPSAN